MIESESKQFIAGNLSKCLDEWRKITSDKEILQTVSGCTIEFTDGEVPTQASKSISKFSMEKSVIVDQEVKKLVEKQVLEPVVSRDGEFLSSIFLVPKKNGTHRLILNLKTFNYNV